MSDEWDKQLTEGEQNLAVPVADLTSVRYGPWSPSRPGYGGCRPSSPAGRKSPIGMPLPTPVRSLPEEPYEYQRRVAAQPGRDQQQR